MNDDMIRANECVNEDTLNLNAFLLKKIDQSRKRKAVGYHPVEGECLP